MQQQQHVFLPFFGGPDDRLALEFVIQICANPRIRGTVVRITKCDVGKENNLVVPGVDSGNEGKNMEEINALTVGSRIAGIPDTVYGQHNTETRMQSETADNIIWARYATPPAASNSDRKSIHSSASSSTRPQIEFKAISTPIPLHAAIQEATQSIYPTSTTNTATTGLPTKLVVVTGRSRRLAVENHRKELNELMSEHEYVGAEVRKTIGDVGTAFVVAGVGSGIVVVQAAGIGNFD